MENTSAKKALKSGVWYTVANFLSKGIGFITMPIFTRLMTKAEIGDVSNFTSWLAILTSILTLDLYTSVTLAKFDYKEKLNEYISSVLVLGSVTTASAFLISIPFRNSLMKLLSLNTLEYFLLFIIPLVSPALHMLQIKNRLEYKYKLSVSLSLGNTFLSAVCGVLCVLTFQDKLLGRLIGTYSVSLLLNISIYASFLFRCHRIDTKYWKYALAISLPLILHVLSGHLLSSSDRIMITRMCGKEANAMYSVAYSCSMVVSILWTSMNTAWAPWAYEQMDKQDYEALKKASRPYLLFFGFVVFCFLMIAPDILLLMGGRAYATAVAIVPPVMVAFVFQFVYSLYVNIETYSKKQKYIALGTTIAAILNVVLNYIFIPVFGYVAAAYTTLAGYAVLLFMHFFIVHRLGKSGWYDSKFNFIFLAVFFVLMVGVQFLYLNNIVRYTVIGILFAFAIGMIVWLRKEILYALKNRTILPIVQKTSVIKGIVQSLEE